MSSDKKFDRFGRYLILDHLVDGGMAKICRARFLGEQADKIVAIKMVQPQFSKDDSFKTMFMDEIKTTFGLLHPNIVQTYDYGLHNEQLFVAMEYCDGRNLKQFLDKLKERNFVFPVEISSYIAIQACLGLHYAHTFTDKLTGKPANIVHRDISPHNIMLTFDGAIKVIDFGIAKSETNSEATQAGTIKGKLSYLAPEYLDGLDLDPRYDLFAVGITLWEMLCSRKLFKASNDLAVLKKIQECKIPRPSSINPNVPEELDRILMKALQKDRTKRYANMEDFARELNKFLYSTYPEFNASDLSYFAKELFKEEIKEDREKLYEFGQIELRPYLDDLKHESENGTANSSSSSSSTPSAGEATQKRKALEAELDFGFDSESPASVGENHNEPTLTVKRGMPKVGGKSGGTRSRTSVKKLDFSEKTRSTKIKKVKKSEKKSSSNKMIYVAGVALIVGALAFKFMPESVMPGVANESPAVVTTEVPTQNSPEVKAERAPSSETARIKFKNFNRRKDKVYINGSLVNTDVLNTIEVPAEKNIVLRVVKPGREYYVEPNMVMTKGELKELDVMERPVALYGYLTMSRACIDGKIYFELFGEDREEELPIKERPGIPFPTTITSEGVSVEREHEVFIQRLGRGVKKSVKFTITESKVVDLCKIL
ncbi:serine/threonine-protein kinase [Bacteriovorax sp. Seq25_V]|uniref:serine/threonine protein kinase n=1 Tax=Bacteriovorax sp. Seq25_V TaxID=1201288 RepID=UPI00038A1D18|nr:serine/threonine-protein kinase [Bacteriovorax sp. Seq25_V]EQC45586.1 kinase domain protein [Bacteriovorax sp. Seq25_V]